MDCRSALQHPLQPVTVFIKREKIADVQMSRSQLGAASTTDGILQTATVLLQQFRCPDAAA